MYILVRQKMIDEYFGHAVVSVAHAAAAAILEWQNRAPTIDGPDYIAIDEWQKTSFRKVICRVSDEEFQKAQKEFGPCGRAYLLMTESAIANGNMCLIFRPRKEWPGFFRGLKMWAGEPTLAQLFKEHEPEEIARALEDYARRDAALARPPEGGPMALYKGVCFSDEM